MSKIHGALVGAALSLGLAACGTPSLAGSTNDAAVVNGQHISMASYNMQVAYKRRLAASGTEGIDPCNVKIDKPICDQLKRTALNDLIDEALVDQYAARHHITVSAAEFNAQWEQLMFVQFHNDTAVMHGWLRRWGLNVAALKHMERENLLQQKVMYQVTRNMPVRVPAVKLARIAVQTDTELKQVRGMLKSESFVRVASLLSANLESVCHEVGCGVLGWLPDAFLSASELKAIRARDGTIIGPIYSQQAIMLEQVEGHKLNYLMNPTQQYALRQQLFAAWVQKLQQHATVHRYVA